MIEDKQGGPLRRGDAPLRWVWGADYGALSAILPMPKAASRKTAMAMASIVVHAWHEARGLDRPISYSRSKAWYAQGDHYGPSSAYGYSTVVGAVDALVYAGILADHRKAPAGCHSNGWQSHFRAGAILRIVSDLPRCLPKPFRFDVGEVVRLRGADGHPQPLPRTREVDRIRRATEAINEALTKYTLTIGPGADVEFDNMANLLRFPRRQNREGSDPDPAAPRLADGRLVGAVVSPVQLALHRVFNRSLELGGRLYGGWWQGVPSSERRHLLIDGERVVEIDYHHLHPRMLYAHVGQRLDGDAYTITGCDIDRSLVKKAFNTMINAASWPEARGAIASSLDGDVSGAQRLMRAVSRYHAPVDRLFCSGLGLRLQRIDSDIAVSVVTEMAVRRGVPCYPVHDSFIVPVSERETLVAVMDRFLEAGLATAAADGVSYRFKSKTSKKNNLHMESKGPDRSRRADVLHGRANPTPLSGNPVLEPVVPMVAGPEVAVVPEDHVGDEGYWTSVEVEAKETRYAMTAEPLASFSIGTPVGQPSSAPAF